MRWIARPPPFSAVTWSVVVPAPTGVTVTRVPSTVAVATSDVPVTAAIVSSDPENAPATSTSAGESPTVREIGSSVPTALGACGTTVTATVCVAELLPLRAVTTTEVLPGATGRNLTSFPCTVTVTTPVSLDRASKVKPAGVKSEVKSTTPSSVTSVRATNRSGEIVPTAWGADETTVTANVCVADSPAARAVTVTEVLPAPTGVIATTVPLTPTVTISVFSELASTAKPAGVKALRTSTATADPVSDMETAASVPTARGARDATVTRKAWLAKPPMLRALTMMDVDPAARGATRNLLPSTVAVATSRSSDSARSDRGSEGANASSRSTTADSPPTMSERGLKLPTATGGLTTSTATVRVAVPDVLLAVISIEVLPAATGVTLTDGPSPTDTVATASSIDRACTSKPAGVNASWISMTAGAAPAASVRGARTPLGCGSPTIFTRRYRVAVLTAFRAVISISVFPEATAVTATDESSETVALAIREFRERASNRKPSGVKALWRSTMVGDAPVPRISGVMLPAGARGATGFSGTTDTSTKWFVLPTALNAVTVTVVVPGATGVTVSSSPAATAVAIASSSDRPASVSPATGSKAAERSTTVGAVPATSDSGSRSPTATGGATTATASQRVTEPAAFCAVIWREALPEPTGFRTATAPWTAETSTTSWSSERTARANPGGAKAVLRSIRIRSWSSASVSGASRPAAVGGAGPGGATTRTVNVRSASPPVLRATTVMETVPTASGVISARAPVTDTVTTAASEECADQSVTVPENPVERSMVAGESPSSITRFG